MNIPGKEELQTAASAPLQQDSIDFNVPLKLNRSETESQMFGSSNTGVSFDSSLQADNVSEGYDQPARIRLAYDFLGNGTYKFLLLFKFQHFIQKLELYIFN